MNRRNRAFRNILAGFINKGVLLIFPLIVRAVLIRKLGTDYAGMGSLFTSVFGVLSLVNLGFGAPAVYFLYKPLVENDTKRVNSLLSLYRKIFFIIGMLILALGLALIPFLQYLVKGEWPTGINIYIIYLIQLSSTVTGYLFFAHYNVLLVANQRVDVESNISSVIHIFMYVAELLILVLLKNYYLYAFALPVFTFLINVITVIFAKRLFPHFKCEGTVDKQTKRDIVVKIGALFGHKINKAVIQTADRGVISAMLGLEMLGKYGSYFYILSALAGIVNIFFSSTRPIIGNSMVNESLEKGLGTLRNILFLVSWGMAFCSASLVCLYQNWITIWVGADNLLSFSTVLLFAAYFWVWQIGEVFIMYRDAAGLWQTVKYYPYFAAGINLILNIVLVNSIGINGIVISTIVALALTSLPFEVSSVFKNYFHCSPTKTVFKLIEYLLAAFISSAVAYFICSFLPENTLGSFLLRACVCLIVPNGLLLIRYRKTDEFAYFKGFIGGAISKIKHLKGTSGNTSK